MDVSCSFMSPSASVPVSLSFSSPPQRGERVSSRVNLSFTTPPVSSQDPLSLLRSHDPIPPSSYLSPKVSTIGAHASTVPGSSSVTPPYSPLRGSRPLSRSPVGSPMRTPVNNERQARYLALTQSAIALREKINAQRRTMESRGLYSSPGYTPTVTIPQPLPGVDSIHQHATLIRAHQDQEKAATKIQSVWKGYRERKGMVVRRLVRPVPPTASVLTSSASTLHVQTAPSIHVTPPTTQPVSQPSDISLFNVQSPSSGASIGTSHPTPPETSPWLKRGGDHYSVVNIYTRRQQELKKLMDERPVYNSVLTTTNVGGAGNETSYSMNFESRSTSVISSDNERGETEETPREENEQTESEDEGKDEVDEQGGTGEWYKGHASSSPSPDQFSAITPPGSPSFSDSFATPPIYSSPGHLPKTLPQEESTQKRYSPQSLAMKMKAELNLLEAMEAGVRQLEGVESTHAVSQAQQETVALAQLLKSQKHAHQNEVQTASSRAKRESEQTQKELQKVCVWSSLWSC